MLHIDPRTKVYVLCPADCVTGGTELLHQMVGLLNDNGRPAYVVYQGEPDVSYSVPEAFGAYNVRVAADVQDDAHNVLIVPETIFYTDALLEKYSRIQFLFWWLSIDNYFNAHYADAHWSDLYHWNKTKAWRMLLGRIKRTFAKGNFNWPGSFSINRNLIAPRITHAYQSEYAQNYLQRRGVGSLVALKDYINTEYLTQSEFGHKENIVLYNPAKGLRFTQRLMAAAPHIEFKPIIGMTRDQVAAAMKRSKVYIDFGNHPGKDRLPRECAMNGCCVITGKEGSAAFFEDVAIDEQYKFEGSPRSIGAVIRLIEDIFAHYDTHIERFTYYRRRIADEKREFEQQTAQLFGW